MWSRSIYFRFLLGFYLNVDTGKGIGQLYEIIVTASLFQLSFYFSSGEASNKAIGLVVDGKIAQYQRNIDSLSPGQQNCFCSTIGGTADYLWNLQYIV